MLKEVDISRLAYSISWLISRYLRDEFYRNTAEYCEHNDYTEALFQVLYINHLYKYRRELITLVKSCRRAGIDSENCIWSYLCKLRAGRAGV